MVTGSQRASWFVPMTLVIFVAGLAACFPPPLTCDQRPDMHHCLRDATFGDIDVDTTDTTDATDVVETLLRPDVVACRIDDDCDDMDGPCRAGVCRTGECSMLPLPRGPCDDGSACTTGDVCADGECVGTPRICDGAPPTECERMACDEQTGACEPAPVDDGTGCDDGLVCTDDDACVGGRCAGRLVECDAPATVCRVSVCDELANGCVERAAEAGEPCSDGDLCTNGDHCGADADAARCVPDSVVTCAARDACHAAGTCNPLSGACTDPVANEGSSCRFATGWRGEAGQAGLCRDGECERLPMLAAGYRHTCALFANGSLFCWGEGSSGALGYGNAEDVGTSAGRAVRLAGAVPAPPLGWIASGYRWTCGGAADGTRCWGSVEHCLGYSGCPQGYGRTDATTPLDLPTLDFGVDADGGRLDAFDVSGGWYTTACARTTAGGARCWGYADDGDPDYGVGYPGIGAVVRDGGPSIAAVGDVALAPEGESFDVGQVVAGVNGSCALSESGVVRCWRYRDAVGVPGLASFFIGDDEEPSSIQATYDTPDDPAVQLCSGSATYLRTRSGDVLGWRVADSQGTLGVGDTAGRTAPTFIATALVASAIGCGDGIACVLGAGNVRCWGRGGYLGTGSAQKYGHQAGSLPMAAPFVQLEAPAEAIAVGASHACAVIRDGRIACWGDNMYGQLGIDSAEPIFGDEADESIPIAVDFD